jgi:4,5-DOPA dioxygenase extradiol
MTIAPSVYLSHGSPMRVLEDTPARTFLMTLPDSLPAIKGIVIISPHWETDGLCFTQVETLKTIYDFGGFPAELNSIVYAAKSPTWLQQALAASLAENNIEARGIKRGLDHGAWSVLSLMYPNADVPVVGLSLPTEVSLPALYKLGQSLNGLRQQGIMIVTTGMATHNLREFRYQGRMETWACSFVDWLQEAVNNKDIDALFDYQTLAPYAYKAHPRDEHLRPLFIAIGASDNNEKSQLLHNSWEFGTGNNSSWAWGLQNINEQAAVTTGVIS